MASFEFTDPDGGVMAVRPLPGIPHILIETGPWGVGVPVDRVEEVVTALRDIARQAAEAVTR